MSIQTSNLPLHETSGLPDEKTIRWEYYPYSSRRKYFFDRVQEPESLRELSDEALIHMYQKKHDQLLICVLMQRLRGPIIGMSMNYFKDRESVESFTHDLYARMCDKFRYVAVNQFEFYLLRMISNMHADHARKQKREEKLYDHLSPSEEESPAASGARKLNESDRTCLLDHLEIFVQAMVKGGKLFPEEYLCLQLRCFEGKKPAKIAAEKGLDVDTVYRHVENAKKKLKRYFERLRPDEALLESLRENGLLCQATFEVLSWDVRGGYAPREIATLTSMPYSRACYLLHQGRMTVSSLISSTQAYVDRFR